MTPEETAKLRHTLTHAVTEYDRKQSKRKGYNIYALAHYLGAVQEAMAELGLDTLRDTLVEHFNGRLLDVVLKAVGEAPSTREEQRGSL